MGTSTSWLIGGRLKVGLLPVGPDDLGALERLIVRIASDAARIDPVSPLSDQNVFDLDVPLDDYVDRVPLPTSCREAATTYLSAYGSAEPHRISALHLLRRIAAAGSFAEFVISGASYPLVGGTTALLDAIRAEASFRIELSTPVRRIAQEHDQVRLSSDSDEYLARAAVVTVPINVWKQIDFAPPLSAAKASLSNEELACFGMKVWMLVDNAPHPFSACGSGSPLHMVWSEQRLPDGNILLVGYGPDSSRLDIADRTAVERALRAYLPAAEVVACAGHDWRSDPWSRETWAVFQAGQLTQYDPALRTPEGRVFFGGSATAIRWPGFIDGAIESGFQTAFAAGELLRDEPSHVTA